MSAMVVGKGEEGRTRSSLLDALPRWSNGGNLLSGQCAEGFGDEVWLPVDHCLPTLSVHYIGGVTEERNNAIIG